MNVVLPPQAVPFTGSFYDVDETSQTYIDWGSATPINTVAELEFDGDFSSAILKRAAEKIKRVSFQLDDSNALLRYQKALVLHGVRERFTLKNDHPIPEIREIDEIVVKIKAIGLNPIDWKSADFGFGIPKLPYVSGRDFAGIVVETPSKGTRMRLGDVVLCPSTDYRDLRKAAYQEYAIATSSTVCRLPKHVSVSQGAALGVAFVAAALALGVCLGLKLPHANSSPGPDLLEIVKNTPLGLLPRDMIAEYLAIEDNERPTSGEWLVIWGGSSTSALFLSQIARLVGLKVILVVDTAKHGSWLPEAGDCICIDSYNSERAVSAIRGLTGDKLRFAIDTVGKDTVEHLASCLQYANSDGKIRGHVVGLAALPKKRLTGVVYHSVPVKLFHEVPEIGSSLMTWLEQALESRILKLPRVEEASGGLEGINDALDRMRQGQISGRRLVVPL